MKNYLFFTVLFLFSLSISAQAVQDADVRLELEEANRILEEAVANSDQEKFLTLFTDDATFKISGKELLEGKEAVLAAHRPLMDQGITLKLDTDEVLHLGEYAHMTGDYALVAPNGQQLDQGKYSTLWKKVNGEWKIYRDMTSSIAPGIKK